MTMRNSAESGPRIQRGDAERFEMADVSCRHCHARGLRGCGDERVVQRRTFGDTIIGQNTGRGEAERQYPSGERRQYVALEPPTEHLTLT